jgi:hypothetical protein
MSRLRITRAARRAIALAAAAGPAALCAAQPALTMGPWQGTWVNLKFNSTGPASACLELNGQTLTAICDADGNVFGGLNPAPFTLVGALDQDGFMASVLGDPVFGDLVVTMNNKGTVSVTGTNVPSMFVKGYTAAGQVKNGVCHLDGVIDFKPGFGDPAMTTIDLTAQGWYADLSGDGARDLFDFLAFVNLFNADDPQADCDGNKMLDLFDFLCFTNAFNESC